MIKWLVDLNGILTGLGLFHAKRVGLIDFNGNLTNLGSFYA